MKWLFPVIIFCICSYHPVSSQPVQDLINAERSFALYAIEHTTKAAFLQYMDSGAVVFDKGQILDAKKVWTTNEVSAGKLLWKPAFAGIAASGDLGFTSGPWQYKVTLSDTAVAEGEFSTIWHKNSKGEWKVLVDLGVTATTSFDFPGVELAGMGKKSTADKSVLSGLEGKANAAYQQYGAAGIIPLTFNDTWLVARSSGVLSGKENISKKAMAVLPSNVQLKFVQGNVSSSGDLAYAYGYVMYKDKQENYLRVWQHTSGGWKIVLMVVQ